ncbi:MAG: excinuclease ABC subunit UvrC [Eubacteriales bacterium]|nr:excinuclease ABC subunit UvrC [Eubacteriales bacterium]
MFDIKENLKKLPDSPGVYLHKDKLGNIIYVGKAISLRNRVRQYFQSQKNMPPKVRSMVENIAEFEYIRAGSETEALILECNLIKKYRPKYNVLLRDDKTYPYIKITNEEWPRVIKTRIAKKDGGQYFGPYSDAGAVNRMVDLLNASFRLKRCNAVAFAKGFRPCLNYHIGQCPGICTGLASRDDYNQAVRGATDFLRGHDVPLIKELNAKMQEAAEKLEYELAAEYRGYIEAAKALSETQRVVLHHSSEADIVITMNSKSANQESFAVVFTLRDGKLVGRETFLLDAADSIDTSDRQIITTFIRQHYGNVPNLPKEILVDILPEDLKATEEFLKEGAGHRVRILKPERGEKRALLKLALRDAKELALTIETRSKASRERKENLGKEIWNLFVEMNRESGNYDGREFRIEAYDISNTNGVDTVGAMVVFQGLKPDKSGYRKFKVRTVKGQDDYGSMGEVLSRRFLRVFSGDDKFTVLPDLIFMDGGKGHVSTALQVIENTGFDIPVVGMVKDDHHRTRALVYRVMGEEENWREIDLSGRPLLYKYIGTVQEEVHRFAIEYHRKLRNKNAEKSVLDEIPGIGPARRGALLEQFGSVEKIRKTASEADGRKKLAEVSGMNISAAENIVKFFGGIG